MLHANKNTPDTSAKSAQHNRRKNTDRRISKPYTKFPLIDDETNVVMKDRRKADRRAEDENVFKNPLNVVRKFFRN